MQGPIPLGRATTRKVLTTVHIYNIVSWHKLKRSVPAAERAWGTTGSATVAEALEERKALKRMAGRNWYVHCMLY